MELHSKPAGETQTGSPAFSRSENARERVIVALDVPTHEAALEMVRRLEGEARWVKVGLELYLAAGRAVVEDLRSMDLQVFLDLKLHDIPNTVAGAVRSVAGCGASLLTLHASGGPAMLRAAVEAAAGLQAAPALLAVTVLTSMNETELRATGVTETAAKRVLQLGTMAVDAGVDGLVCSPEETAALRAALPETLLVVPGIRNAGDAIGDQSRTASAAETLKRGASYLVIGRPITGAKDPAEALRRIVQGIQ